MSEEGMKTKLVGIACNQCMDEGDFDSMMDFNNEVEEVLDDGTVVRRRACTASEHIEEIRIPPHRNTGKLGACTECGEVYVGKRQCPKCSYGYTRAVRRCSGCGTDFTATEMAQYDVAHEENYVKKRERVGYTFQLNPEKCPKCGAEDYPFLKGVAYGPLKHRHGGYGNHDVSRRHRDEEHRHEIPEVTG